MADCEEPSSLGMWTWECEALKTPPRYLETRPSFVYVYDTFVCVHMHMCANACGGQRSTFRVFLSLTF